LEDNLWRVLQVGVNDNDGVPLRIVQAGRNGCLVAEVARKVDDLHAFVLFSQAAHQVQGAVRTPVIDQYQLVWFAQGVHHGRDPLVERF